MCRKKWRIHDVIVCQVKEQNGSVKKGAPPPFVLQRGQRRRRLEGSHRRMNGVGVGRCLIPVWSQWPPKCACPTGKSSGLRELAERSKIIYILTKHWSSTQNTNYNWTTEQLLMENGRLTSLWMGLYYMWIDKTKNLKLQIDNSKYCQSEKCLN